MDNSNESDSQILGLGVDEHNNQNISFEAGTSLGTKRLHLDSESSVDMEVGSLSGYIMGKRIKMENNSEDEATSGLMQVAGCDELGDENGIMLGSTASEGMSSNGGEMAFANDEETEEDSCILIHHMNIKEPLINLKKAMETTHGISLEGYDFYLQDTSPLADNKNLVEQCVQGCGTVQVNLQLKIEVDGTKKINIIDVLKPSDSYLLATGNPAFSPDLPEEASQPSQTEEEEEESADKNLIRWVVDNNFKSNQQRLQIPQDPMEWEVSHVRHWLLWAVRQFNLTGIKLSNWNLCGAELCSLTLDDFKLRVPYDPNDIFWTHLELLRRCKFVAVMQNPDEVIGKGKEVEEKAKGDDLNKNIMRGRDKKSRAAMNKSPTKMSVIVPISQNNAMNVQQNVLPTNSNWGNRTGFLIGNNGQVQLWQFLLDLLTDKNHRECIQWLGAEGEFKLIEPERVAALWGQRKNKPSMNYEKLSRALRYYYDGDMIAKVHGKRFVYKFVCDLKQLLGYSAFELNRLVIEAEMRALNNANDPLQHSIFGDRNFDNLP